MTSSKIILGVLLIVSAGRLVLAQESKGSDRDARSRWLNTSYDSTIYHEQGKQWAEMDNASQKIKWSLTEMERTVEYIELFNATRNETWRLLPKKVDLKKDGRWEWIATGHWDDSSGKPMPKEDMPGEPE